MNKTLVIVLATVGGGGALLCCGCGGLLGLGVGIYAVEGNQVRDKLLTNAVLKEHVGEIRSLEHQLTETLSADEDNYYFRVEGSKGSGTITVGDSTDLDLQNLDATLRLDSSQVVRLTPPFDEEPVLEIESIPNAERDLKPKRVPKTERDPKADHERADQETEL